MPMTSNKQNDRYAADIEECRRQLRVGSRSFHAAAFLLPRSLCAPASALYAFCRIADDAVDDDPEPVAALDLLHGRLDDVYARTPRHEAADRALTDVVHRFGIPKTLFTALFEGFAWDAKGRRYQTLDELLDYAARVAGTVGAMMALLMGVRDRDMLARACDLGCAMQLSNIARDVGEDARAGRLYLPVEWLHEAGIDPDDFLANPVYSPSMGGVVQRLLHEAGSLYRRADSGVAKLPARCRSAMGAARLLYAEIGHEVARNHCDSISRRAVVPPQRKLTTLLRLPALVLGSAPALDEPALAATGFLVSASVASQPAVVQTGSEGRLAWMLELFEDLERRDSRRAESAFMDDAVALAQESRAQ